LTEIQLKFWTKTSLMSLICSFQSIINYRRQQLFHTGHVIKIWTWIVLV